MATYTPNKAASIERSLIKRKIRSLERRLTIHINGLQDVLGELRQYIGGMASRASTKKGGLGRR